MTTWKHAVKVTTGVHNSAHSCAGPARRLCVKGAREFGSSA